MPRHLLPTEASVKLGTALCIEAGVSPEKTTDWSADGIVADDGKMLVKFTVVHVMSEDRFNELLVEAQR